LVRYCFVRFPLQEYAKDNLPMQEYAKDNLEVIGVFSSEL